MRFVINTITYWEEPPRARHQVTFALARKFKVAYVSANKIGLPKIDIIINQKENIVLIQPYFPMDVRIRNRIPLFNEIYQHWLFSRLKKKFNDVDVINFDFSAYLIHKYFRRVYYYCNDNFTAISRKINIWPIYIYHSFCERQLIKHSAFCIGTSPIIAANLRKISTRSYEIPLGGPNIEEFDLKPSDKRLNIKRINIGLVGFISDYNLSYHLINDILSKIDCIITLIGPVDPDFHNKIADKEKIELKGVLKDKELLMEVNRFDVAIAPYLDNKILEGGMPNKLFVYLAMGKPVVVTELKCLTQMNWPERFIYLVNKKNDFPGMICRAHQENNAELIQLRADYARNNTWDKRIEKFCELLESYSHKN